MSEFFNNNNLFIIMSELKSIKIENFNLNLFGNLLNQSLSVTPQLMLEFKDEMVKSCSFSSTKSLVKLWTNPISSFIVKPQSLDSVESLDGIPNENDVIDTNILQGYSFNFYILRGDLFRKYMNVFNKSSVTIEIKIKLINEKYQATSLTILGKSENGSPLITTFPLTTEELITNAVNDYSEIIRESTPDSDMFEILLHENNISEIKSLVKNLKGSSVENVAYLNFEVTKSKIIVSDKVFTLEYSINEEIQKKNTIKNYTDDVSMVFNILKSDFLLMGDHTFSIFTKSDSPKVIFGSSFVNAIIWCLTTKHDSSKSVVQSQSETEDMIDSLNLEEYGLDLD